MNAQLSDPYYVLGSAKAEHDRLIRQAEWLAPYTERLFRDAGIKSGQRVLDIGCGVGDVALLTARLVGPTGVVVGVDRDATALAKARARATDGGFRWARFVETDICDFVDEAPFDAVVGRFVLMFQPNPTAVLRRLAAQVRPGGLLVFQEGSWPIHLALMGHLPLWSACANLLGETLRRSGVQTENALPLCRAFQDAGLPPPDMRFEVPIGTDPYARRWLAELFATIFPRLNELGLPADAIGDIGTLGGRLERELEASRSYAAGVGLAGVWARRPAP